MKVSKGLKAAAIVILLNSLLWVWMVVSALSRPVGVPYPLTILVYSAWATVAFIIAIGLLRARKIAVYAASIFSTARFFSSLAAVFESTAQREPEMLNPLFVIFYAIVIWLSISCIVKDRQQNKVN